MLTEIGRHVSYLLCFVSPSGVEGAPLPDTLRSSRSDHSFLNPNTPLSRMAQHGFSFASNSPFHLEEETPAAQVGVGSARMQWPWEKDPSTL
mmetsp:Transcript_38309/g.53182  ORF Transcript_38309/g.53182 Transcript_38309/m.53182 type:complete len:92 (-) Transcript_38309:139-414(-)